MMRGVLMGFGFMLLGGALWQAFSARQPTDALGMAIPGAVIVLALLCERYGYRATSATPPTGPEWSATPEQFIDPTSGDLMVVWFNRRTGKRLYVRFGPA